MPSAPSSPKQPLRRVPKGHPLACRVHQILGATPALEAGVTDKVWHVKGVVALLALRLMASRGLIALRLIVIVVGVLIASVVVAIVFFNLDRY
jgi:hypothetical protein